MTKHLWRTDSVLFGCGGQHFCAQPLFQRGAPSVFKLCDRERYDFVAVGADARDVGVGEAAQEPPPQPLLAALRGTDARG